MKDKALSFYIALVVHASIFFLAGVTCIKSPEYGTEQGLGAVEVELIADKISPESVKSVDSLIETVKLKEAESDITPIREVQSQEAISSISGAVSEAKPDYLKNPAPVYPDISRRRREQGVVLIEATIDQHGWPIKVMLKKSSGFHLLDQAALKAVKRWKFHPARLGNIAVESSVYVPVRFHLTQESSS